ncbi:MFS transporter [Microseira wollei]|uniref:Major facilitator superfamily MFS_1 n=1 Tax=Microseira wollei NIES-4236 TaxID=2530354 RepID=A0AAV3XFE3_9CYAN|nr:MFS transporter [Microseira wollei]GET41104.1 major facilitator superfamily MFS_1 [Microseira wollei NIES-4236]
MKVFILIWFGQLVSLIGSGLTGFALGIWVYQRTGSVTDFALISLFTFLPSILLLPLAGAFVDRWNRRSALLVSDCGAGISTLTIAVLLFTGRLAVWQIYLAVAASSIFRAFHWPAYNAAIAQLVPKKHLSRASGMVQFAQASSQLIAPVLAGVLVGTIQVQGVILIDFATFLFAFVTLLFVRIPKPKTTTESEEEKKSLLHETLYGWTYISTRPGLLGLLIFYSFINFTLGIVEVLLTPLVLSFASTAFLGTILSIGGSGMLLGSVVISVWSGLKRRIYCILGFTLLQGLLLCVAGFRPSAPLIAAAAFIFLFSLPLILASNQAIWFSKVAPDVQGRVFAVQRTIGLSSLPCAYIMAGPLADRIFEPLLTVNGPLAKSIGLLIGVGPGRGIGLVFIIMGILNILAVAIAYLYPSLRLVEDELPDIIAEIASTTDEHKKIN